MVNLENYEAYLMLYVDEELNDAEQKAVLDFVRLHPELEDELKLYQTTKALPDTTKAFTDKKVLLKPVPAQKTIALRQWWLYGAAAGVILIVFLMAGKWQRNKLGIVPEDKIVRVKNERVINITEKTLTPKYQPETPAPSKKAEASIAKNSVHSNTIQAAKEAEAFEKKELETIAPIMYQNIPGAEEDLASLPTADIHPVATPPPPVAEKENNNILAWLPEEKQQGLEMLKGNIDEKIEKAKTFKDNLKDTQLALKFGSKELVVINF